MNNKEIMKGIQAWIADADSKKFDDSYKKSIKKRDVWGHFENLRIKDVKDTILRFLNKWQCRIPYESDIQLLQNCKKTAKYFRVLKEKKLSRLNFEKKVKIDDKKLSISDVIKSIFDELCKANRVKSTAASKIMHMANPKLFVMWDDKIADSYGFARNYRGYINFLEKMKEEIKGIRRNELYASLKKDRYFKHYSNLPLTKLIDMYNYEKYTEGKELS